MTDQSRLYFVPPDTFPLFNFLFIWSDAPSIFWAGLLCFCFTPNLLIYHWPCHYCTTWIPLYGLYFKGLFYFISFWKTPINRLFKNKTNQKQYFSMNVTLLCVCLSSFMSLPLWSSGLLHGGEKWPSFGYCVYVGGAAQFGHADDREFSNLNVQL